LWHIPILYITMNIVIKVEILTSHKILTDLGKITTGLYNCANYQRQKAWKETGKIPNYFDQTRELKDHRLSRLLYAQVAQQTLRELDRGYKSWYALRKKDERAKQKL